MIIRSAATKLFQCYSLKKRLKQFILFLELIISCSIFPFFTNNDRKNVSLRSYTEIERQRVADVFVDKMRDDGYDVQEGIYYHFLQSDCVELLEEKSPDGCYGNNPTSPYGIYAFDSLAGEYVDDIPSLKFNHGTEEQKRLPPFKLAHRIREDEAYVYIGKTPPKSAYFGFTHYTYMTHDRNGTSTTVFGSLSDTINPSNIQVESDGSFDDAFNKDVVIITTPHRGVYSDIQKALDYAGVPSDIRNLQEIPSSLFKAGLGKESDVLTNLNRVALIEDEVEADSFLHNPPVLVFRLTPREPKEATISYRRPKRVKQRQYPTEFRLEKSLDELEEAVFDRYSPMGTVTAMNETQEFPLKGQQCILLNLPCYGDNSDAAYFINVPQNRTFNGDQFFVIIGVNHHESINARYSHVVAGSYSKYIAVAEFNSIEHMPKSSYPYISEANVPKRDMLYAATLRRDCAGHEFCMEMPYGLMGLDPDESPTFVFRAYMAENSTVGHDTDSLLRARVYFVDPT